MLKRLYFLLSLIALTTVSNNYSGQFQDISWDFKKNSIDDQIMSDEAKFLMLTCFTEQRVNHISNEYNAIIIGVIKENEIFMHVIEHIKKRLNDDYQPLVLQITALIDTILASEEFNNAFLQNINYIVNCIVKEGKNYNAIVVPHENDILDDKIEEELIKAFPEYDELAEELFGLLYLKTINQMGCNLLLKKLLIEKYKLIKEMYEVGYSVYGSID